MKALIRFGTLLLLLLGSTHATARDLPAGLKDHGVAAPVGRQTFGNSIFATVDGDGKRVVVMKIWAGSDASYLFVDAETGESEQLDPGLGGRGGWPMFFLPEENKAYDTMGKWLLEIDVPTREIRRVGRIPSGMALGFTADREGVVYASIYPSATVVSYDPESGEFTDHGKVNDESWPQYPRPMAADESGWIYVAIGQKLGQIAALDPATGETRTYVGEEDREQGQGNVFLGTDGNVYASAPGWGWHAMSQGEATPLDEVPVKTQPRHDAVFPDGSRYTRVDVANRTMEILDAGEDEPREVKFDYDSPGVPIYCITTGPDGNIYGATGIPLRIWRFNPATGAMTDWGLAGHTGHVNQFVQQGEKLYGAIYSSGSLIEYDPSKPYHDAPIRESRNPKHVHGYEYGHRGDPDMFGRPYALLAHPDGRHVVMGGNPARVLVGGGMLIYDVKNGTETVLKPDDLLPDQGVMSIAALPGGDLIVGSTTNAATAGSSGATAAMLYRLDWKSKEIAAKWAFDPPVPTVRDLLVKEGLVYGLAADNRFFVFDPEKESFVHDEEIDSYGGFASGQAPRGMAAGPDGGIYVLFRDAIVRFAPDTFAHREVVRPGVPISAGITIHENRLYFASAGRLYSYDLE